MVLIRVVNFLEVFICQQDLKYPLNRGTNCRRGQYQIEWNQKRKFICARE